MTNLGSKGPILTAKRELAQIVACRAVKSESLGSLKLKIPHLIMTYRHYWPKESQLYIKGPEHIPQIPWTSESVTKPTLNESVTIEFSNLKSITIKVFKNFKM